MSRISSYAYALFLHGSSRKRMCIVVGEGDEVNKLIGFYYCSESGNSTGVDVESSGYRWVQERNP